jgi:uncharacterized membrane protein YqhA
MKQKVLNIIISVSSVTFFSQYTKRMRSIVLSSLACLPLPYISNLFHKRHDFRENVTEHKTCILISPTTFVRNISRSKKNWAT